LNAKQLARVGFNVPLMEYLTANMQVAFVGKRPRESFDPREPVEAYTLIDATIRAHDFYKGLELFCSVHNLLDEVYVKPSLAETFPEDYPLPGRSFLIGVRYAF
jgi:outer membrane receptor for ferrienterochelin and colicin